MRHSLSFRRCCGLLRQCTFLREFTTEAHRLEANFVPDFDEWKARRNWRAGRHLNQQFDARKGNETERLEDTLFGVVHPGMHLEKAKRANRQLGFRCLGEIDSFFLTDFTVF